MMDCGIVMRLLLICDYNIGILPYKGDVVAKLNLSTF